jgi:hypothetical protein
MTRGGFGGNSSPKPRPHAADPLGGLAPSGSKQETFAEAIAAFYPNGKDRATLEILETSRRLS